MSEPIEFRVSLDEPIRFNLATGPQGPVGEKGDKGDTGEKGDKGEKGDPGTTDYNQLENKPDLTTFYKKTEADERFVAKEEGKGLSSNDYTATEKTKLAGIAEGAEKNLPVDTELSETSKNAVENKTITAAVNSKANQAAVDEISSDTKDLLNALTTTDRGSNLNLKHTVDSKIRGVKLLGDTTQAKFSGKNLLEIKNSERTINGVKFTPLADGRVMVVGTATANATYPLNTKTESNAKNIPLSAGVYTINGFDDSVALLQAWYSEEGGETKYSLNKIELSKDGVCGAYLRIKSGKLVNKIFSPQIERGDKATDWEPYVGGQPSPNPDYPQEIKTVSGEQDVLVCGKNLYNPFTNTSSDFKVADDGWVSINSTNPNDTSVAFRNFNWVHIPNIEAGKQYKLCLEIKKLNISANGRVVVASGHNTNNSQFSEYINITPNNYKSYKEYTLTALDKSNGAGLRFFVEIPAGGNCDIIFRISLLNLDDQFINYEPYQGKSYPINLGSLELCKLGDYQDRIFYDNGWNIEKRIAKVEIDGSSDEVFVFNSSKATVEIRSAGQFVSSTHNSVLQKLVVSDKFTEQIYNHMYERRVPYGVAIGMSGYIYTRINDAPTLNDVREFFIANPAKFYVPLQLSSTSPITDQALISQLDALRKARTHKGITNIMPSCEIEVDTLASINKLKGENNG
mgnify:CR=1 FL=1